MPSKKSSKSRKSAAKRGAAAAKKKSAPKRPAAKKVAAKRPVAKKVAAKRPVAKKPAARTAPAKKAAPKKKLIAAPPKAAPKKAAARKAAAPPKKAPALAKAPVLERAPTASAPMRRRDAAGHIEPKYAQELLERSGPRDAAGQAFVDEPHTKDDLAEELGEEFVGGATSGEGEGEDVANQVVPEERGGPFVITSAGTEFADGVDESNPKGARREPFPTT